MWRTGFSTHGKEPEEAQSPAEVLKSHVRAARYSTEPIKWTNGGSGVRFYVPGVQWGIHTSDTVYSKGRARCSGSPEERPSKMGIENRPSQIVGMVLVGEGLKQ